MFFYSLKLINICYFTGNGFDDSMFDDPNLSASIVCNVSLRNQEVEKTDSGLEMDKYVVLLLKDNKLPLARMVVGHHHITSHDLHIVAEG